MHFCKRKSSPWLRAVAAAAAISVLSQKANLQAQAPAQNMRDLARQIRIEESAQAMVNMPSIAPLFLENSQFSSTLYVVNEGGVPVSGRLLLLAPNGELILDRAVTVPGHDKSVLPISSLIQLAHSNATQGSIELFDDNVKGSALVGEVVIAFRGEKTAVNIDEELLMPAMSESHQLRGLAIDASGSPVVSVGSTSDQPVKITVSCTGERSKTVRVSMELERQEVRTLRPCSGTGTPVSAGDVFHFAPSELGSAQAIGITVQSSDPKAEIQAFGLSPTLTDGVLSFAPISFHELDDSVSNQTVYPGVPVGVVNDLWGTYHPKVAVQNYSDRARDITIYNARTEAGRSSFNRVDSFVVAPLSIKTVDIAPKGAGLSGDNTYVVESDGEPGDVLTQLWSEEDSGRMRVLFAGKDRRDDRNAGMHPWSQLNGSADDLYLYNQTDSNQPVNLKVSNRVSLWKKTVTLSPHETRRISIRDLADGRQLDDSKLPFTLGSSEGEISWFTESPGTVRGRLQHRDEQSHSVTSFQCAGYVVFCGILPITGPSTLQVGQSASYSSGDAMACVNNLAPQECYGVEEGSWNAMWGWSGFGGSLTLDGVSDMPYINVTGASAGSATLNLFASSGSCLFEETATVAVLAPTVAISVKFTGSLSSGDNLSFLDGTSSCNNNLGLQNCSTTKFWGWNIEGKGVVSDDASKWIVAQLRNNGLAKGYYENSAGTLTSFSVPIPGSSDGPAATFLQQTSGQKNIYWIDGPGNSSLYDGHRIDSITEVQNFTTTMCSRTDSAVCSSTNWYVKLVVDPGSVLDTAKTSAGYGSASTNF